MKKIAFALIIFILVALPFIFANKGAQLLEEKGYSVTISEKTDLYFTQENCEKEPCDVKGFDVQEIN